MVKSLFRSNLRTCFLTVVLVALMIISSLSIVSAEESTKDTKSTSEGGMYGGIINVAIAQDVYSLNPCNATDEWSWDVLGLVYDSLARIDPTTLEVIPWIASGWMVNSTANTVTVTLEQGVKWHDFSTSGRYVTAEDVEFTYSPTSPLRLPPSKFADALERVVSVWEVDDYTVTFTLSEPYGPFFTEILSIPLLPITFDENSEPNGCGPFKCEDWAETHELTVNLDYFRGRPYIDGIKYLFFKNETSGLPDSDAAVKALINGTVDFIMWPLAQVYGVNLSMYSEISMYQSVDTDFCYLGFNMRNQYLGYANYTGGNYTDMGKAVRKAIALSVDKNYICSKSPGLAGFATVADSVISSENIFWYNENLPQFTLVDTDGDSRVDPEELEPAKNVLTEAGYFDVDGDGFVDLPGSSYPDNVMKFSLTLKFLHSGYSLPRFSIGDAIGNNFQQIGLNVTKVFLDPTNITTDVSARNFDIVIYDASVGLEPSFIKDLFHSESESNIAGYHNASFDALVESATSEMDITARQELVKQSQEPIAYDLPFDVIYYHNTLEAYRNDRFIDWTYIPGGINNFHSFLSIHRPIIGNLVFESLSFQGSFEQTLSIKLGESKQLNGKVTCLYEPVSGINISFSSPYGYFSPNPATTQSDGTFSTLYTASPSVSSIVTDEITVTAYATQYNEASEKIYITIRPIVPTLTISTQITLNEQPTVSLKAGQDAKIIVTVKNQNQQSVSQAMVSITVDNAGSKVSPPNGKTNSTGVFVAIFNADEITVDTHYRITVNVYANGYEDASATSELVVFAERTPVSWFSTTTGAGVSIGAIVIIGIVVCIFAIIYMRRKKEEE